MLFFAVIEYHFLILNYFLRKKAPQDANIKKILYEVGIGTESKTQEKN
jgi:hypothetical protein